MLPGGAAVVVVFDVVEVDPWSSVQIICIFDAPRWVVLAVAATTSGPFDRI